MKIQFISTCSGEAQIGRAGFELIFNRQTCPNVNLIGNGVCSDELNIEACEYDGGDCYGDNYSLEQWSACTVCECIG